MPDEYGRGPGYLRGYNSMQMQAGITPQGPVAPLPMLSAPPHPSQTSAHMIGQTVSPAMRPRNYGPQHIGNPQFSTPTFGYNRQMAFNNAIADTNSYIGSGSAMAGTAARVGGGLGAGAIGAGIGSVFGPIGTAVGGLAGSMMFEGSGMGQGMHNMAASIFDPLVRRREQASQMQALSQNFVRGGQNLSMTGQGLSMNAAQQVSNNLRNMSQSQSFQTQTGGMFNTKDVSKISQLAGELGMLDQSQNVDQITRDVKKISTALGAFMKLAGEPDVQEAMKQMGQMRNLGMNFPQMSSAARNARQFARMAGTDVSTMMQAGMQGAQTFQAYGLSGAAGMQASMAGQGLAGMAATSMTARQLSMAGGQQGLAGTLTNASAQAGTMDILLPALLQRQSGGGFGINRNALSDLLNGNQNIQDVVQQGASNVRRLGGRSVMQALTSTQRRELQSEMMESMSPEMQALLPMVLARRTAQSVPGMTMGGALRTMGYNEQQARSMELMSQSPEFQENVIQQRRMAQLEMREERSRMRDQLRERVSGRPDFVRDIGRRTRLGRRISGAWDRASEAIADWDDVDADIEARGGNVQRVFARDRYSTSLGDARRRDALRTDPSSMFGGVGMDVLVGGTYAQQAMEAGGERVRSMFGPLSQLVGPDGVGFTQQGRGGELLGQTFDRSQGTTLNVMRTLGFGAERDPATTRRRARSQANLARAFSRGRRGDPRMQRESGQRSTAALRRTLGEGTSDERLNSMRASATSAVAEAVEEFTINGHSAIPINPAMLKGQIYGKLRDQGYSDEEILAVTQNEDVFNDIVSRSTDLMDDTGRARIEEIIGGGSELEAQLVGQGQDALQDALNRKNEEFFETIGVDTGWLSDTSEEDQRKLRDMLGGGEDDLTSQVAGYRLMAKYGEGEERDRALRKLMELEGEEGYDEAFSAANRQIEDLGEEAGRSFARQIADKDGMEAALREGGQNQEDAGSIQTVMGLNALTGGDTEATQRLGAAAASGNASQLRDAINEFIQGNSSLSEEKKERLRGIAESGDVQQQFAQAIEQEGNRAGRVAGGEGGDADLEEGENQGLLGVLSDIVGFGGDDTAGGGGGLGAAASELSEAAKDLREAAENFNSDRTINGLNDFARRNVP